MNINNLRAAVRYFEDEPLRLHMSSWIHETNAKFKTPPCGTVACLAGSAVVLSAKLKGYDWRDRIEGRSAMDTAMEFFEIDKVQADQLFYVASWPHPLQEIYDNLEKEFSRCAHPHVWPFIKKQMVYVLNLRVEDFISETLAEERE